MADPVDRLYGLPLEEFTRERDALARELRREKRRDEAAAVAKLPKPTQAAWAANLLARERRELVDELLRAGEALREAQDEALAGKGAAALRDAGAAERAAVDALVEAAKDVRPSGRPPTATTLDRLRTILHAAAGDDEVRAALDGGRVVRDAEAAGAWGLLDLAAAGGEAEPAPRRPARPRRAAKSAPSRAAGRDKADDAAGREAAQREAEEREAAERAARERRRELDAELATARLERRVHERALARAEREAERAEARLESALAAAEEARQQVEEARAEVASAREAADAARDHVARLEEQVA